MSHLTSTRVPATAEPPAGDTEHRRKGQPQQPRQLLSCTKCRERKVKCDRTKPCTACCARGAPKECHFVAEGGDYAPIQQSYELRKLRAENLRLKERLRAGMISIEDGDTDPVPSPESHWGERPASSQRRRAAKQKRFQGSEWQDSIYFGSPGLASVMNDFASINIDSPVTLAYIMPKASEIFTPPDLFSHPFATLFQPGLEECIPQLLSCLPSKQELLRYLECFENRVNVCSFPHMPLEITSSEIERFLSDAKNNAMMCPDMLALLFAALALGTQHSVWTKSGGGWNAEVMVAETQKGGVYIAASMQALRLASFMHKPTLLGIQTLIMMGPYLTNSGRFLDAWTLFGTTIRLAHSIGLHRHPKYLDPVPPTQRECSIRQTLWWWMLYMDEQYSMTLGRPLGISGMGDCPAPQELTTDPAIVRFGEFVTRFTVLARQILSSDRLSNLKIDDFTDAIKQLLDTMPETLQFDESWSRDGAETAESPLRAMSVVYFCKAHTYLILLNRQRNEKYLAHSHMTSPRDAMLSFQRTPSSHASPATSTQALLRGRPLVLSSSEDLVSAFMFFYNRDRAALIDWTLGQQAFNSCMILLCDAIETRRATSGVRRVEQAYFVFKELDDQNVHKLAGLAVLKISQGLMELRKIVAPQLSRSATTHEQQGGYNMPQDPDQKETTHGSESGDTVMGNSGMFLLEDTGLQSFVQEAFAPIAWTQESGSHSDLAREFGKSLSGETKLDNELKPDMSGKSLYDNRYTGGMLQTQRSTTTRSPPTRYATSVEDDDSQLHGHTAPKLHARLASAQQQQQQQQQQRDYLQPANFYAPPSADAHQHSALPHLQHTQTQEAASILVDLGGNEWTYEACPRGLPDRTLHSETATPTAGRQYHVPFKQSRHNSCPTIPRHIIDAPQLRPTYSSPSTIASHPLHPPQDDHHGNVMMNADSGVAQAYLAISLPPSTGRTAVAMASMAGVAPMMASTAAYQDQQHVGYPFPAQFMGEAQTMSPLREEGGLEEWREFAREGGG